MKFVKMNDEYLLMMYKICFVRLCMPEICGHCPLSVLMLSNWFPRIWKILSTLRTKSSQPHHWIFRLPNWHPIVGQAISGVLTVVTVFEKKEEIWLSPVPKTPTPKEQSKKQRDNIKTPLKTLITQLLPTDLGRSVRVAAVTQLVWLNRFTSAQPSH